MARDELVASFFKYSLLSFGYHPQWLPNPFLLGVAFVSSILSSLESGKWVLYAMKAKLFHDVHFVYVVDAFITLNIKP